MAGIFDPGIFDPGIFDSEGSGTVTLPLLDSGPTLYAPTAYLDQFVDLELLDGAPTLYSPEIVRVGDVQELIVPLLDSAPALYSPTLVPTALAIVLGVLDGAPTLYAPTAYLDQFVTLGVLDGAPTLYAPVVIRDQFVTLGLLTSTATLYAPTIIVDQFVTLSQLDAASALYAPAIIKVLQDVILPLLDGAGAVLELSVIQAPPPFVGDGPGTGVVIKVNGVNIADIVRYSDAVFVSQVNGTAGTCQFAVRDLGHDQAFVYGQTISLEIDGVLRWSGYLQKSSRQYSAAVVDTSNPQATARWFFIEGSDVNILFARRVTHDAAHPTRLTALSPPSAYRDSVHADQWREDTPSDEMVRYVIRHYTDMLDDGVYLSGVENLGTPNPDWAGATAAAQTVGDFMRSVNSLLGGIFYLTPEKEFVHRPVEVATTAKYLSDYDDGNPNRVGVRDYSFVSDASAMINDAHVWGTAPGVSLIRHARAEDATSIATHGRWQGGEFNMSMYKQASLDHRADALINGNSASRHGAKDDRVQVTATVFTPDFFLGDVVTCKSHVYADDAGHSAPYETDDILTAILPVRRIMFTFPTPTDVRYDLLLTQELDEPWNIYEYKFPKFKFDPLTGGPGHIGDPPKLPPVETEGGCSDDTCGITDAFGRSTTTGWTTSDSGLFWSSAINATASAWVEPGVGRMHSPAGSVNADVSQTLQGMPLSGTFDIVAKMRLATAGHAAGAGPRFRWNIVSQDAVVDIDVDLGAGGLISLESSGGITDATTSSPWGLNTDTGDVYIRWQSTEAVEQKVKIWAAADPEPGTWLLTQSLVGITDAFYGPCTMQILLDNNPVTGAYGQMDLWVYEVDIVGINRCLAPQFEDFAGRTVSNGWGSTNPSGYPWTNDSPTRLSVSSGIGFITLPYLQFVNIYALTVFDELSDPDGFTMLMDFVLPLVGTPSGASGFEIGVGNTSIHQVGITMINGGQTAYVSSTGPTDASTPFTWTGGGHYFMRWQVQPGVLNRAKFWLASVPEPDAWTVSSVPAAFATPGQISMNWRWNNGSSGGSGTYQVNSIDLFYEGRSCYPCGAGSGSAETFARANVTVVELPPGQNMTAWGAGPLGQWTVWVDWPNADSGIGVGLESGRGVFRRFASASPATGRTIYASLPALTGAWTTPIEILVDWSSESFSNNGLEIEFVVAADVGGNTGVTGDYIEVEFQPGSGFPSTNTGRIFFQGDGIGNASSPIAGLGHGTFVVNETFRTRLLIESTQMRAKLWKAVSGEPETWDLVHTYAAGTLDGLLANAALQLQVWCHSTGATYVDRVEVVGAGSCSGCTETILDSFDDRSVAANTNTPSAIGNTSGTGDTWVNESFAGAEATYAIESGVMKTRVVRPSSGNKAGFMGLLNGSTNIVPYSLSGTSFPDAIITGTEIDLQFDFMVDSLVTFTDIQFWLLDGNGSDYEGIEVGLALLGSPSSITIDSYIGSGPSVAFTFVVNTWYTVRIQASGGTCGLKVWATGTAEPAAWQVSCPCLAPPWPSPGELSFQSRAYGPTGSGTTTTFSFNNFLYRTCAAVPDPGVADSGVPLTGEVWETLSHSGGSDFNTTRVFVPGSLQVWINGALTLAFTTDPVTASFHLTSSISSSDVLRVKYLASGDIN